MTRLEVLDENHSFRAWACYEYLTRDGLFAYELQHSSRKHVTIENKNEKTAVSPIPIPYVMRLRQPIDGKRHMTKLLCLEADLLKSHEMPCERTCP